ncbi:MAG: GLPGLI family protein [Prevotellaceae bacterium]|jgi:GLPGLI family protein|nr:GLPGLI family protein [Prevotellaceae bacterium]
MKRTTFFLLLLLLAINNLKSQEYKEIDDCSAIFMYNYQFYEEHKNPESLKQYEMALMVGKNHSKFCSSTTLYTDSLIMVYSKESSGSVFDKVYPMVKNLPSHVFCSYSIYKNYPNAKVSSFIGRDLGVSSYYSVEEEVGFDWNIDNNSKKTILGLSCIKATCHFAGRDYEAWFTTEIPIIDGPYKFNGLPGLIVRVADSDNEHVFELQEIRNVKEKPIYFVKRSYINTDAKGYVKALEASKSGFIERLNTLTFSDDAMRARGIARIQRRNNFIEKY